jgi:hypothetical protein
VNRASPLRPGGSPARVSHVLTCAVLVCLASPRLAWAAQVENRPELKVLLVVEKASDPFIERIRAEVASLGLQVITRAPAGPLESDAREQHAVAAIRVLPSRKGVEVWMADATTGRTLARQLVVDERPQGPDQTLVALQTAEILRTGLFPQAHKAAVPPVAPPPPQPIIVVQAAPSTSQGAVVLGLGGLYSPGGAATSLQAWGSFQRRWQRGFGLALDGSMPIVAGAMTGPEGRAKIAAFTLGAELFATLPPRDSQWLLTAGIGGGLLYLRSAGEGSGALLGATSSLPMAHGYARVETGVRVSHWARLALTTLAGTTFKSVSVRFADNQAGTWGSVLLAAFLSFSAEWD